MALSLGDSILLDASFQKLLKLTGLPNGLPTNSNAAFSLSDALAGGQITPDAILSALAGQQVVSQQFISQQVASSDAFSVQHNGARWHFGTGTNDWASSDGSTVSFAGAIAINGSRLDLRSASFTTFTLGSVGSAVFIVDASGNLTINGALSLADFVDDSATPGPRTLNAPRGKNTIASGAASVVITNSFVTTNSQILITLEANDVTATSVKSCIPGSGMFTLTVNANATANLKFAWTVIN